VRVLAHSLSDIEEQIASGAPVPRAAAARVLACVDLISVGVVGEAARRRVTGNRMTYGRVRLFSQAGPGDDPAAASRAAGEVRLTAAPDSLADAVSLVRAARPLAGPTVLTGFTPAHLQAWGDGPGALSATAAALREAGLDALAEVPMDEWASTEAAVESLRAIAAGGLACWRATVTRAEPVDRLGLIARTADVQHAVGGLRAFAPLPRVDSREAPSTGYDDVRTIAAARVLCLDVPLIQVDWPLYGPKLAQVALTYGANDIDGVSAVDEHPELGARRSPEQDVMRQIRAAGGEPAERDGRCQVVA
jgi:aminodeoxyfutalosine synthase